MEIANMNPIESSRANGYEKLFQFESYLNEIKKYDFENMLSEIFSRNIDLFFGRKLNYIDAKTVSNMRLAKDLKEKESVLRDTRGLYIATAASVCSLVGPILSATSHLFSSINSHYLDKFNQSKLEKISHLMERNRSILSEESQSIREAEQESKKAQSELDRILQLFRQQMMTLAG